MRNTHLHQLIRREQIVEEAEQQQRLNAGKRYEKRQQLDVPELELLVLAWDESDSTDVACQQNFDDSSLVKPGLLLIPRLIHEAPEAVISVNKPVDRVKDGNRKLSRIDKVRIVEEALTDDLPVHGVLVRDS